MCSSLSARSQKTSEKLSDDEYDEFGKKIKTGDDKGYVTPPVDYSDDEDGNVNVEVIMSCNSSSIQSSQGAVKSVSGARGSLSSAGSSTSSNKEINIKGSENTPVRKKKTSRVRFSHIREEISDSNRSSRMNLRRISMSSLKQP